MQTSHSQGIGPIDLLNENIPGRRHLVVVGKQDIDMTVEQVVPLLEVPADGYLVSTRWSFVYQLVDSQQTPPMVSIGTNAPDYDNIVSLTMPGISAIPAKYEITDILSGTLAMPGQVIQARITPATATACIGAVGLEVVKV